MSAAFPHHPPSAPVRSRPLRPHLLRPRALLAGALLPGGLVPLMLLVGVGPLRSAPVLPFDPLPSAFQRWLNARPSPAGQPLQRFSRLGHCKDTSSGSSPYRTAGYRCLSGQLNLGSGQGQRVCRLLEVTYILRSGQVRYRTADC